MKYYITRTWGTFFICIMAWFVCQAVFWENFFCLILLTHERSHREVNCGISNPARHLVQVRCRGLLGPPVPCHPPALTAQLLTLHRLQGQHPVQAGESNLANYKGQQPYSEHSPIQVQSRSTSVITRVLVVFELIHASTHEHVQECHQHKKGMLRQSHKTDMAEYFHHQKTQV